MSTAHSTESAASEGDASAPDALQGRVTIRGEEMDPSLWSPGSTAGSQPSSSQETQAPPAKKARLLSARPKSMAQKTKMTSKKPAAPKKKTPTKKRAAAKSSSKQAQPNLPPMRWTVALTALAIEIRFKNPRILKKFADTADARKVGSHGPHVTGEGTD
ncbi:unnamed protein product [Phytophthora fragariaefolia]|uniref:Unnamed protein product n=1 Tax=Phytophthora fragariaefolia TaxID=1490495 RepID=A0A9W6XLC9_9STRA|nr:unnamed protein product [Phytophthora fragariaefolia]